MKPGERLAALRAAGYQVKVRHERLYYVGGSAPAVLLTRHEAKARAERLHFFRGSRVIYVQHPSLPTARTTVRLRHPDGTEAEGIAECSGKPDRKTGKADQFSRPVGLQLALDRALEGIREQRRRAAWWAGTYKGPQPKSTVLLAPGRDTRPIPPPLPPQPRYEPYSVGDDVRALLGLGRRLGRTLARAVQRG